MLPSFQKISGPKYPSIISQECFAFAFIVLLLLTSVNSYSQSFQFQPNVFGTNVFAGGLNNPRFQFVDITGDGKSDLFILDKDERLWFYKNIKNEFTIAADSAFGLISGSWFKFVDIDADGDFDFFSNAIESEVTFYQNIGTAATPKFVKISNAVIDSAGNQMFSERFSIPTFADIDGDGDVDFFTGSSLGQVTYYENIGTPQLFKFKFITSSFQGINIQGGSFKKALHGASVLEFYDSDSNGTLDLFWGDYFNPSLYFLKNNGTKQLASIVLHDSTYPKEAVIKTLGFNMTQHSDIDNDGAADLMVSCLFPTEGFNNFMFYKNSGTNMLPEYVLQTKNFLPMIDVGSHSNPIAADIDGDGDGDVLIGDQSGKIYLYKNNGTRQMPQFNFGESQIAIVTVPGEFYVSVAIGDINGDGKPDLLIGGFSGKIRFFNNTTVNGIVSFFQESFPLDGIDVGQNSSPAIIDIDNDGLLDIFIGNSAGQLWYYKNNGTAKNPTFQKISEFYNGIDVGNDAVPSFVDLDGDGRKDLLIGNYAGTIYSYKNISSSGNVLFSFVSNSFEGINVYQNCSPAFFDIDNDGDNDLFIGNLKGGVYFYRNLGPTYIFKNTIAPNDFLVSQNYPNPFNPETVISYQLPVNSFVTLKVYDVMGREVATLVNEQQQGGKYSVQFNAQKLFRQNTVQRHDFSSGLASGVYFYETIFNQAHRSQRFVRAMVFLK